MADASQFAKVKDIVTGDKARRVVIVSAAGDDDRCDQKQYEQNGRYFFICIDWRLLSLFYLDTS